MAVLRLQPPGFGEPEVVAVGDGTRIVCGRTRSLLFASVLGLIGTACLLAVAFWDGSVWLGILTAFIALGCWRGFRSAQALARVQNLPRHTGFACPVCHAAPPEGALWQCGKCRNAFDAFVTGAMCPHCGEQFPATGCPDCGRLSPFSTWLGAGMGIISE